MIKNLFGDIQVLSSENIRQIVSMKDAINAMEAAFSSFSMGTTYVPQRHISAIEDLNLFLKPAFNEKLGRIAVKVITQQTKKPLAGYPTILGVVLLIDIKTGAILSMMDGACITALRTGAASGLATKLLANENAETVAVFGCGTQGKTQLESVCNVRPIQQAYLFDLNKNAAQKLKAEMQEQLNISIHIAQNLDCLKEADVICTATQSEHPLFRHHQISKGAHINAVGSYQPNMQEIDPAIIKNGRLFVDSIEAVLKESGDLIKPINELFFSEEIIEAEIGDLINKKAIGRKNEEEISIFKSVGLGVQDLFMANAIYEKLS
jgi:ornithine cyclodeaminase/alanine dehydrogenase-like protein (mu-crystallin family)